MSFSACQTEEAAGPTEEATEETTEEATEETAEEATEEATERNSRIINS
ncbi:MAG: hypothetical protein U5N58_08380 [Actinomycetota bacterium]|nr:hypothetical protein [Actinomycetota bacterium]